MVNKKNINVKKRVLDEVKIDAEILYKKIVENMNEGVWMGDLEEKTVYVNPKFRKMLGYSLEEMLGRESYDFWDEESRRLVKQENKEKRRKGKNSSYIGNLLTKAGKKIPVLLNGTPLPDGGTIGIMTDLTDLRNKERDLRVMQKAIEYSSDAVIILDEKFMVRSWNRGAKIVFGYKRDEMVGKKLWKLILRCRFEEAFDGRKVYQNFFVNGFGKKKVEVDLSLSINRIEFEEGEVFYLLIARDITDERRYQEILSQKYLKIQEAYNQFGTIRRQMDYMFDLMELARNSSDKSVVVNYIVNSLVMISSAEVAVLRKFNQKNGTLDLLGYYGGHSWEGEKDLKLANSVVERAFKERRILKIVDIYKESGFDSFTIARKWNLSSVVVCPIIFDDNLIGSVSVYFSKNRNLAIYEDSFLENYLKLIELVFVKLFWVEQG